jgi:hypothetical protein
MTEACRAQQHDFCGAKLCPTLFTCSCACHGDGVVYGDLLVRRKCPCPCGTTFWCDGSAESQEQLNRVIGDHCLVQKLRERNGKVGGSVSGSSRTARPSMEGEVGLETAGQLPAEEES